MVPDLTGIVQSIFNLFRSLISLLDTTVFDLYGFRVSIWSIVFSCIIVSMAANVWWKGAKG